MNTNAPKTPDAIGQVETLEDLRLIAEQRRHINSLYGPAAAKLAAAGIKTKEIADAYGIKPSTAHVLIRDAA